MPYCDECGNKVSVTDKRCSKCGKKLDIVGIDTDVGEPINKIKQFLSPEPHHNIEFILALIGVLLSVLSIPDSLNSYAYTYSDLFLFVLIALFVAVIGAILIRYHAKIGAVVILISGFSLVLFGIQGMALALVFFIIAAVLAFVR